VSERRTHWIEIGAEPRPLDDFAFRRLGGKLTVRLPRLPDRCVCCSQPAERERIRYHVSDEHVSAEPFELPLCRACQVHGLIEPDSRQRPFSLLMVGAAVLILAWLSWLEHGVLEISALFLVPGLWFVGIGMWRVYRLSRRRRAASLGNHHGDFGLRVSSGVTTIETTNDQLAADILAYNSDARERPMLR
jgi:hypothetical protein